MLLVPLSALVGGAHQGLEKIRVRAPYPSLSLLSPSSMSHGCAFPKFCRSTDGKSGYTLMTHDKLWTNRRGGEHSTVAFYVRGTRIFRREQRTEMSPLASTTFALWKHTGVRSDGMLPHRWSIGGTQIRHCGNN